MSVETVLALFGGAQLVLIALVAWLGKLWLERALARERHARERELESLRADQQLSVGSQLERLRSDLQRQMELESKLREDRLAVYNRILEPFMMVFTADEAWKADPRNKGKDKRMRWSSRSYYRSNTDRMVSVFRYLVLTMS